MNRRMDYSTSILVGRMALPLCPWAFTGLERSAYSKFHRCSVPQFIPNVENAATWVFTAVGNPLLIRIRGARSRRYTLAPVAKQHFLSNGRDVQPRLIEDLPDRQAPTAHEAVAPKIMEMPAIRPHRTVKPDGVIEARREQHRVQDLVGFTPNRVSTHHRIGRKIVRKIGK